MVRSESRRQSVTHIRNLCFCVPRANRRPLDSAEASLQACVPHVYTNLQQGLTIEPKFKLEVVACTKRTVRCLAAGHTNPAVDRHTVSGSSGAEKAFFN